MYATVPRMPLHQFILSTVACCCCCCLLWHLRVSTLLIFITMPITKVILPQIVQETSTNMLPHSSLLSPSRATLSVIDRMAGRRLLASKDSWRKPLCCFEVLIDAIIARISKKKSCCLLPICCALFSKSSNLDVRLWSGWTQGFFAFSAQTQRLAQSLLTSLLFTSPLIIRLY